MAADVLGDVPHDWDYISAMLSASRTLRAEGRVCEGSNFNVEYSGDGSFRPFDEVRYSRDHVDVLTGRLLPSRVYVKSDNGCSPVEFDFYRQVAQGWIVQGYDARLAAAKNMDSSTMATERLDVNTEKGTAKYEFSKEPVILEALQNRGLVIVPVNKP